MQEFAHDKFNILEHSDVRFSFEQDIDLKHAVRSKKKTMLYVELAIGVLITVLIIIQVAWTITGSVCVIPVVLALLSHLGARWLTEGASCTKVEINTHRNKIKISNFQRDSEGHIWHAMSQEQVFDMKRLEHLAITQGKEMHQRYAGMKDKIEDEVFMLSFNALERGFPVILYMASTIEDVQRIKDQLETIHASPFQMSRI